MELTKANAELIVRLTRDMKTIAKEMSDRQARFFVDSYYQIQENRKRSANQVRALEKESEPYALTNWLFQQFDLLEAMIKNTLDTYSGSQTVGQWMRKIPGIGPVIAAGLLAHIDIEQAPTVGHIWRFAGYDPTCEWKKGERRPFNAALKTLCWKIGESFVKQSGREKDIYGKLYLQRKEIENAKNEAGLFADQAALKLEKFNIGKKTDAYKWYKEGKLPPAHIHARSKRWAVKIFLSHLHHVWFEWHYGKKPPNAFAIEHLGHAHYIEPPFYPMENQ